MRKWLRSLTVLVLALACALSLTGCSSKSIAGTYQAEYDLRDVVNAELQESGVQLNSSIIMPFILVLNEDKTYTLDTDSEAFRSSASAAFQADKDTIVDGLMAGQGVSEENYDSLAQASGYDDYQAFKDQLIEQMISELQKGDLGELEETVHTEGTYDFDDSTVTFSGSDDSASIDKDGNISMSVELESGDVQLLFVKQK